MNIFRFEFRSLRPIPWIIALGGTVVLMLSMFSSISRDVTDFSELISKYPEAVRTALSMDIDMMSSVLGLLGFSSVYTMLIGAAQSMLWGMTVITKERRFHTAEFLLAKPRSRNRILGEKTAAVFSGVLLTFIAYVIVAYIMINAVGNGYDTGTFVLLMLGFICVQLVFFSVGLCAAVVLKKIKNPLPVALSTVFGTFIIGSLGDITKDDKMLFFSPFKYFNPVTLLKNGHYDVKFVVFGTGLSALALAASFLAFQRQDIQ